MSLLLDQCVDAWWGWILPLSAHLAVLGLVVAAIDLAFVRRPYPRLESLLWGLIFVKVVLPPSLTSPVSLTTLVGDVHIWSTPAAISITPVRLAALLWLGGTLAWLLVLVQRSRALQHTIERTTTPVPPEVAALLERAARRAGLRRTPAARMVSSVHEAAVVGLRRPTVLVPSVLSDDAERLEHVLLHECAHLRRGDLWWSQLTLLLAILLWFHPVVWLARGRLAALRELACDARVARLLGPDREAYRQTLLSIAQTMLASLPAGSKQSSSGRLCFFGSPRDWPLRGRAWCLPWWAGWWGGSLLVVRLVYLRGWQPTTMAARLSAALLSVSITAVVAVSCLPLAHPPEPLWERWANAPGCLQKRFLLMQALPPADARSLQADSQPKLVDLAP